MSESTHGASNRTVAEDSLELLPRWLRGALRAAVATSNAGAKVGAAFVLVIVLVTVYEVFTRYVLNKPTIWSVDFGIYSLVWLTFISLAWVQKEGRHVAVDLLVIQLERTTRAILEIATTGLFLFSAVALTAYGFLNFLKCARMGETSIGLLIHPIWPVKMVIWIGGLVLVYWLLVELAVKIVRLKRAWNPSRDGIRSAGVAVLFLFLVALSLGLMSAVPALGMLMIMLVLLFFGLPVFPSLMLTGLAGVFIVYGGFDGRIVAFPQITYGALNDFSLVAMPTFVLCGAIIERCGMGKELYEFCTAWLGRLPGGEAVATVVALSIFAAISASSVATAATIGVIAIPSLLARRYSKKLTYGLLAAGGTLGIMIPPSGSMIIYSAVTEESLGKLFIAGVIPGLLLAGGFAAYIMIKSVKDKDYERAPMIPWNEKFRKLGTALWALSIPAIIMGGIMSGVFTPLESGGIAAMYGIIVGIARRRLTIAGVLDVVRESLKTIVMIFAIIVGALVFGYFATLQQIPNALASFVLENNIDRWVVFAMLMGVLLIMGMFLEVISILMITMPIFYPLMIQLGFDGIWFAVVVTLNMELALITPPVGLNCYVIQGITGERLSIVLRGIVPFALIMATGLIIFSIFPTLSTWLPSIMVGR